MDAALLAVEIFCHCGHNLQNIKMCFDFKGYIWHWQAQKFLSVSTICTKFILGVYSNSPRLELEVLEFPQY